MKTAIIQYGCHCTLHLFQFPFFGNHDVIASLRSRTKWGQSCFPR